MGWFSSLGNRISGAVHSLGQKVRGGIKRGRKFVHDHAAQIERVSKTIGDVAGVVGNVATAALPFVAEIPGVNVAVAGVAAGGKAAEAGARWVQKGAGTARKAEGWMTTGEKVAHQIDDVRRHPHKTYQELQSKRKQIQSNI